MPTLYVAGLLHEPQRTYKNYRREGVQPVTAEVVPLRLTTAMALRTVREIAADTNNIVVISHARRRGRQREITRRQIELCVQRGTISEGPFINQHGHWQVNLQRHAAGEEITCVVAIEWCTKLLVITTF